MKFDINKFVQFFWDTVYVSVSEFLRSVKSVKIQGLTKFKAKMYHHSADHWMDIILKLYVGGILSIGRCN